MRSSSPSTSAATLARAAVLLASIALAAPLVSCSAALASGPASVTVRVEGSAQTLIGPTLVTTSAQPVSGDGNPEHNCSGFSALGALTVASGGEWTGTWFNGFHAWSLESVKGESHAFGSGSFWDFWMNHQESLEGLCEAEPESGAEVLLFPCPETGTCPSPLAIEAPAVAGVGEVSVRVLADGPTGTSTPVAGALVSGGASTVETGPEGRATVTFATAGEMTLRASAPESVRDEVSVCVHHGEDGTCGTRAPAGTPATITRPANYAGATPEPPYKGPYALVADVSSVQNAHTYNRADAPRLLAGTIHSHSAVSLVRLKLRRSYRGRCYAYDATRGRFARARCGSGSYFTAASGADFSYLLPKKLGPGRYVLDVQALDVAGNQTTLARGSSRIVFFVH